MAEQLAELNKGDLEVYSTDEKQIGVWIDGKPIYRKVCTINNSTKGSWNSVAHNISNLGTVISCNGVLLSNNSSGEQYILGGYWPTSYSQIIISITSAAVYLGNYNDFDGKTVYITFEYTKN